MKRITKERATDRRMYAKDRAEYLVAHPYCQIFIARHRLDEQTVIDNEGVAEGRRVPRGSQIHHRNKCYGARLLDKRWWMSASHREHEWVENHKDEARKLGLLLPIQADADGHWGADQQALTTPELLASFAR